MNADTIHPLAAAWLRDLELLLHGIEPGERAEVLAGVHEHLEGSLAPGSSDDDVRRVLADLGSPQSVADEAYAGRPATVPTRPTSTPVMARAWVPVTVGILLGLYLVWLVFVVGASVTYTATSTSGTVQVDSTGREIGPVEEQVSYDTNPLNGVVLGLATSLLLWVPALALTLFSPLWSTRHKTVLCLIPFAAAVTMSGLPAFGFQLTHSAAGVQIGAWLAVALAVLGGGALVFRACRSALVASRSEATA